MLDRRHFLAVTSSLGLTSTLFPGILWGKIAAGADITAATIAAAEEIAGVKFDDAEREMMLEGLKDQEKDIDALHEFTLANSVTPAVMFNPLLPDMKLPPAGQRGRMHRGAVAPRDVPKNLEELAFLPITELSELVRRRKVSATDLTQMYLARLKRYDPQLLFVITLTEDRALAQAKDADADIRRGRYRGPLHGVPWGAKDLLAVKDYPTTWGAAPYKTQVIDEDATVVKRLDAAGAILIAKLTLGALALGDQWYGGMTRNPWKPDQGSSGSSAGPASATAAGCVGFSIGSETLGSISSPSSRCGATGLRPSFGRVPRTGAMALSWSQDKLGPICRSAEDCALVLDAIHGTDGQDSSVHDAPFEWNAGVDLRKLRIGYLKSAFDADHRTKPFDDAALEVMRGLAPNLTPVALPEMAWRAMSIILSAESAAAFDDLTRSGRDKELTAQSKDDWPNQFRVARFIPAADYVNANRMRTIAMQKMAELMKTVDVIVTPTNGSSQLLVTNLTGHPALILPNGFREDGTPVSLTFLGDLFREAELLAVARAYQEKTGFHLKHPELTG